MKTVWLLHIENFYVQFLFIETLKFLKYVKLLLFWKEQKRKYAYLSALQLELFCINALEQKQSL